MIQNRTKILATIGPACAETSTLKSMVNIGVNAFRVNLSHGDESSKRAAFKLIRESLTPDGCRPCILADLAGPKIRIKDVVPNLMLKEGDTVFITNEKPADQNHICVSSGFAFTSVNEGAQILINDGRVVLEVVKAVSENTIKCSVLFGGEVKNRKGVNFPGITLDVPTLTEQDKVDLKIALEGGADWIALSFVRSAEDRKEVDTLMASVGKTVPVMAKIEKWEALEDAESIIETFDAVMVARGDLGVEIPSEKVPSAQKNIIKTAHKMGKPVVIATQMLESMVDNPTPTRAEVSDIANAIYDGADALLVTGETAAGRYPEEVVRVLKKVILETEQSLAKSSQSLSIGQQKHTADAISHATCQVAEDLNIRYILSMTHSGSTARMISRYRPPSEILALTPLDETCRQLSIVWGVKAFLVSNFEDLDQIPDLCRNILKEHRLLSSGEKFVITGGVPMGAIGTTNYLSVQKMEQQNS